MHTGGFRGGGAEETEVLKFGADLPQDFTEVVAVHPWTQGCAWARLCADDSNETKMYVL
jgi:hypothetical protein